MDSAGVEVVAIRGELPALGREFDEAFVLGGAPDGPGSFFRVNPSLVDVDDEDRIHILDATRHRIVRFAPDGELLGTVGRRGRGPGEFEQPFALAVAPGGEMVVADRSRRQLMRIGPRGEPLEGVEVEAPIYGAAEVAIVGTSPVYRWWQWSGRASGTHQLIWGAVEPRVLAQMPVEGNADGRRFPSCPQGFPGSRYLDPGLVWTTSRSGVAVTPEHDYEIRVFSEEGELVRIIRRDVQREAVTTDALLQHMDDPFMANTGRGPQALCPVPLDEAIRIKGYLEHVPAITDLALSNEGEIWARRGTLPFEAGEIDVYDARGNPLGTLPPGTPFPVAFTSEGMVSVREDEMGVQRLVVWRRR